MKRNIIKLALATVCVLSLTATAFAGTTFQDVKSTNWAYSYIDDLTTKGIVKGYGDNTFRPNNTLTYCEFIKLVVVSATGEDLGNASGKDNSGNKIHWATNYYDKAIEQGYFRESQIGKKLLSSEIDRQHMALIIANAYNEEVTIPDYDNILKSIKDVESNDEYEYEIVKSYYLGFLNGYEDNTFRPYNTLTRAESTKVVSMFLKDKKEAENGNEDTLKSTEPNAEPITEKTDTTMNKYPYTADKHIPVGGVVANTKDYLPDMANQGTYDTYILNPFNEPDVNIQVDNKFLKEYLSDTCVVYNDASQFDFVLNRSWTGETNSFYHTLIGRMYMIKDGKVVEEGFVDQSYDDNGNYLKRGCTIFNIPLSEADYIMSVTANGDDETHYCTVFVKNPFK